MDTSEQGAGVMGALAALGLAASVVGNTPPTMAIECRAQGAPLWTPNPANKSKVVTLDCSEPNWSGPCVFTMEFRATVRDPEGEGIESVEGFVNGLNANAANTPPTPGCNANPPSNVTSVLTTTFPPLPCGFQVVHEVRFDAWDCGGPRLQELDWTWIQFICVDCDPDAPVASTYSNGTTYADPMVRDTPTNVQFVVHNRSQEPSEIILVVSDTQGWPHTLPPPSVDLPPGGSFSFLVEVTVPAGTAEGTVNTIALTADISGVPGSASTAEARVVSAQTNVFRDFAVEAVRVEPGTGTSYDVEVDVVVVPGSPWTGAIPLRIVSLGPGGETIVGGDQLIAFGGQLSGQCCDVNGDCETISGWTATCGPSSCVDPDQAGAFECAYRRTVTLGRLYMPANTEILAVLDPDATLVETAPGSELNNSLAVDVPLPGVNRSVAEVIVVGGGAPGLHDIVVLAALDAILDEHLIDLSAEYSAFVNGDLLDTSILRSLSASSDGVATCYDNNPGCTGTCPSVVWEGVAHAGTCTQGSNDCTCRYARQKTIATDVPLEDGDEVMVCLTALPEAEPEALIDDDCAVLVWDAEPCPADVTGDDVVNVQDLVEVILNWGPCPGGEPCGADVNGDLVVNVQDLVAVILGWGAC